MNCESEFDASRVLGYTEQLLRLRAWGHARRQDGRVLGFEIILKNHSIILVGYRFCDMSTRVT